MIKKQAAPRQETPADKAAGYADPYGLQDNLMVIFVQLESQAYLAYRDLPGLVSLLEAATMEDIQSRHREVGGNISCYASEVLRRHTTYIIELEMKLRELGKPNP